MQSKTQLCHRLATARQWLHQAEESFGKKQEMQGELNLFLAQAELQHVREGRKLPFWLQPRWGWQRMAMAFAVLLALSAGAGIFWAKQNVTPVEPVPGISSPTTNNQIAAPAVAIQARPIAAEAQGAETKAEEPSLSSRTSQSEVSLQPDRQGELKESSQAVKAEAVSPEEMQKALRAAGKALRGVGQ